MKLSIQFGSLLFIFILTSCQKPQRTAGLCLSLDDRSIKAWYSLRPIFKEYDAKVTFFVTQFDSLSAEEIVLLKELQQDGHEIASHGAMHVQAEKYIKENSYRDYFANEIKPSIASMKKSGFTPTAFAYPYGSKYWFTDFMLLHQFKVTRGVSAIDQKNGVATQDEVFYAFDGNKKILAAEIDHLSGLTKPMVTRAMDRALQQKEVLLLCGHEPSVSNQSAYFFDVDFLKFILEQAKLRHLKFYSASELIIN